RLVEQRRGVKSCRPWSAIDFTGAPGSPGPFLPASRAVLSGRVFLAFAPQHDPVLRRNPELRHRCAVVHRGVLAAREPLEAALDRDAARFAGRVHEDDAALEIPAPYVLAPRR